MPKVIMFSRFFPASHPRAKQETLFVEKFFNWCWKNNKPTAYTHHYKPEGSDTQRPGYDELIEWFISSLKNETSDTKHHTIRAGHRFKAGELFSPRCWSGRHYNSKQIILAPPVEVKKVWDFKVEILGPKPYYFVNGKEVEFPYTALCGYDGLSTAEFMQWFPNAFDGQIICWDEKIEY